MHVNSWLYCSGDKNCRPGRASSARINIAIAPPTMKNPKEVTRYSLPISLWSVVDKYASSRESIGARTRDGSGLVGGGNTVDI